MRYLFSVVWLAVLLWSNSMPAVAQARLALVIGNSAYTSAPLSNPVNDSTLIAKGLQGAGFAVTVLTDLDQTAFKRALQAFGSQLAAAGPEAVGVFYYAGHGMQVRDRNYLIPIGAAIQRESDVDIEAVAASAVLELMADAGNRLNIVIMDACRDNPFVRSTRSSARGLARMDAATGVLIAYSTAPGQVALDGNGVHSPYAAALAAALRQPGLPVEQVFKAVRRQVMRDTDNQQVPWESSSLTGDFYFTGAATPAAPLMPAPVTPVVPVTPVQSDDAAREALTLPLPVSSPETESNDSFGRAMPIASTTRISGRIIPRGDNDWYTLTAPGQGELTVNVTNVASALDLVFRLWNADKAVLTGWYAPLRAGGDTTAVIDLPTAGDYYLELADNNNDATAEQPYQLAVAFTRSVDGQEPNDTFGTATALTADSRLQATILPRGDSDWYSVRVEQQGEWQVAITDVAENLDLVFRVWNANKDVISQWYTPLRTGGDTTAVIDLPAAGWYYLEVADSNNDARAIQPYTLTLAFRASNDLAEPNDNFAMATTVALDESRIATILPRGDSDWYRLTATTQGELAVAISNVAENLDVVFRVWNANKDVISQWYTPLRAGGDTVATVDLPTAGNYYLEVADGNYDARSVQPYALQLRFAATGDAFEPDDSFGSAARLVVGATLRASILPRGDVDWYRFVVDRSGELEVTVADVPPTLDVVVRLWNAEKDVLSNWLAPRSAGGETSGRLPLPEAGEYYLEVRDGNDDQRAVAPYRLSTRLLGAP